jgi:4,5-DOPA dioxygenase extradiol
MTNIKMPVIFLGHGSPMNALANNEYTKTLNQLGERLPKPKAILCVSAHWMTKGTYVTHMAKPKTVHDFHGFPKALFEVSYPASGSPQLAEQIVAHIQNPSIGLDAVNWGLDHGTWSVLRHVYPKANIPVVQMSMDMTKPAEFHFELGKKLQFLREQDVLIIGSGNIVHNLRSLDWDEHAKAFDWALEFDEWVKEKLEKKDFKELIENYKGSQFGALSVPTPDHYFPLLYVLGAAFKEDSLLHVYEEIQNASISMRCFSFG